MRAWSCTGSHTRWWLFMTWSLQSYFRHTTQGRAMLGASWSVTCSPHLITYFFLIVILNQPRPPSQQCCSNCHTALLLYIAAAAVHAQCLSPATHACWPAAGLSMSFCNPITSAATTGRFCFYGPLQRSAAIHPCYVCQAHHFQGKNKSRRSLMPNFPLNCFSACCNYT